MRVVRTIYDGRGVVVAEPNACALCGIPQREHGQRFHAGGNTRTYVMPDDATRLARMKLRHEQRKAEHVALLRRRIARAVEQHGGLDNLVALLMDDQRWTDTETDQEARDNRG